MSNKKNIENAKNIENQKLVIQMAAEKQSIIDKSIRAVDEQRFESIDIYEDSNITHSNVVNVPARHGRAYGSLANPINGERLLFRLEDLGNFVWDKSLLIIEFAFGQEGDATAFPAPATSIPPAFMVGELIDSVIVNFNRNSEEFYRSNHQDFYHEYIAKMLTHYTSTELKNHPNVFSPLPSESTRYLKSTNEITNDNMDIFKARADLYFTGGRYRLHIPFIDIFPKIMGVINNLITLDIELVLTKNTKNIVPYIKVGANYLAAAERGTVLITDCIIQRFDYYLKVNPPYADTTYLSIIDTEVYKFQIPTSLDSSSIKEWFIPQVSNLQSIFIYQSARGIKTNSTDIEEQYVMREQMFMFGCGQGLNNNGTGVRSSQREILDEHMTYGLTYLQMIYGNEVHPDNEHEFYNISNNTTGTGGQMCPDIWYNFALKSKGRLGDEFRTLGVKRDAYRNTMPFIYYNFGSPGTPRLKEATNLRIRYAGIFKESEIVIVLFKLRGLELSNTGAVKQLILK